MSQITKKDVIRGWAKYYTCAEVSSGFERLTAPAFSFGMNDVLKKLYDDNQEEYINALKRHLLFYNSEATWGSIIFGITCALEEERASMGQNARKYYEANFEKQKLLNQIDTVFAKAGYANV